MTSFHGIYVILDVDIYDDEIATAAEQVLRGGVRLLQYRAKGGVQIPQLRALRALADRFAAKLIINDDLQAATAYGDGLHVGQVDLTNIDIGTLRHALGDRMLGVSVHTTAQAAAAQGADYLGVGPYRATLSKVVLRPPLGCAGLQEIRQVSDRPICAIGGVEIGDIASLRAAGMHMVAVIGAIAKAGDREGMARAFCLAWAAAVENSASPIG